MSDDEHHFRGLHQPRRRGPVAEPFTSNAIEVTFCRVGTDWRLTAIGDVAPYIWELLDESGTASPVPRPDLQDLAKFMWALHADYDVTSSEVGVVLEASGRSIAALWGWLYEYLLHSRK